MSQLLQGVQRRISEQLAQFRPRRDERPVVDSGVGFRELLRSQLRHDRVLVSLAHADHQLHLGGVQLYMRVEQRRLDEAGVSFVNLWPADDPDRLGVSADGCVLGQFRRDEVAQVLAALPAAGVSIAGLDLHHLQRWPLDEVTRLATALGRARVRLFLHDYHSICANPNLTFGASSYCGAPPPESQACALCRFGDRRRAHVDDMRRLLGSLEPEVIAPSHTAATMFLRHYPEHEPRTRVVPHQQLVDAGRLRRLRRGTPRLGFVGYGAPLKGTAAWTTLLATPQIRERFHLFHFGLCSVACSAHHVNVDFIREGFDAMPRTLVRHALDFALLWSVWPETFSFTVHEAIAAGAYVLTNENSGNIAAQVRATGRGRVFADFDELCRFLLDDREVAAARASLAGQPLYTTVWDYTLADEISR